LSLSPNRALILALLLSGIAAVAQAGPFSSVVVYGDSLSDNGNLFHAVGVPGPPYYMGRRSDGPVAVEQLASALGAPLVDFAWLGATSGIGNYGDGGTPTSFGVLSLPGMQTEFASTQAMLGPFLSTGLFVVWGGANDFLAPSSLDTTPQAVILRAVSDVLGIVTGLEALGAHNILVPGMPDLGLTPDFQAMGPVAAAQASAATDAFNQALQSGLPPGVFFYDTAALVRSMVANPAAYGFTNVTDPCFNGTTVCANPSQYLFFDGFHPTTATNAFAAQGFLATVTPEPSTFGLIFGGLFVVALKKRLGVRRS
jgi:phospholipase/lecithinase/hemolysin